MNWTSCRFAGASHITAILAGLFTRLFTFSSDVNNYFSYYT